MAAQPGGDGLVPDKFDVLVTRETERHNEGPGPAQTAVWVLKMGAGAEIHLRRITRCKAQSASNGWRFGFFAH